MTEGVEVTVRSPEESVPLERGEERARLTEPAGAAPDPIFHRGGARRRGVPPC